MKVSVRKRLPAFVILSLLGSCWKGLATDTPFLDIVGYDGYDGKRRVHVFLKRGGEKVDFKEDDVVAAADPAYDQTFKRLFIGSAPDENGHSGEDRLKGFLNSIFFPEAEGNDDAEQIVRLEPWPTELSSTDLQPGSQKALRMDVACRCYCGKPGQVTTEESVQGFDVEMQTTMTQGFPGRLFEYATYLSRDHSGCPIYAIGILAPKKPGKGDHSLQIALALFDEKGNFKERYSGSQIKALTVDLHQKLVLMNTSPTAEVLIGVDDGRQNKKFKQLGTTGKQWLRLLGMRYYMKETNTEGRYWIPLCNGTNDLVRSGISALGACKQEELTAAIARQKFFDDAVDTANKALLEDLEKKDAENKELQESNREKDEEIKRLREELEKAMEERDQKNMENLKKHGGSPVAVALLRGEAS